MAKPWDTLMKMLVGASRQDFVSFLLPGARYVGELNTELQSRTLEADLLYTVIWKNRDVVLHVEFQRRSDANMGRRLWMYNAQTDIITRLPVSSFVIYLKESGKTVQSPYDRIVFDQEISQRFFFRTIKLWEISRETFKQAGIQGLLPLLPLTQNGVEREAVDDMITSLDTAGKSDLLPLGYAFAALVMKKAEDQNWLRRRFAMLRDILEESWAYQEMVAEGLAKGMQQGEVLGLREAVIALVLERFPDLADSAQHQVNALEDTAKLRKLVIDVGTARDAQEVVEALALSSPDQKQE